MFVSRELMHTVAELETLFQWGITILPLPSSLEDAVEVMR